MRLPLILALVLSQAAIAGAAPLAPVTLTEWKSKKKTARGNALPSEIISRQNGNAWGT